MNAISIRTSKFQLPPDFWLVVPHTHATGGVERTRRVTEDGRVGVAGRKTEAINVQIIADESERERAEKLANAAKSIVVKHLQYSPLGYLATADSLALVDRGIAELLPMIEAHNRGARFSFATVEILRVKAVPAALGEAEVKAIADKLRTELVALRDAVRSGDAAEYRKVKARAPNLPSLTIGAVKLSVEMGIDEAAAGIDALRDNAKAIAKAQEKGFPVPVMLDPATLNLGQLETAIEMVTDV